MINGLIVCEGTINYSNVDEVVNLYDDLTSSKVRIIFIKTSDTLQCKLCLLFESLNKHVDGFTNIILNFIYEELKSPEHPPIQGAYLGLTLETSNEIYSRIKT